MRVIGMFTAWGCRDWAVAALRNHLKICDVIWIAIKPHAEEFLKYQDETWFDIKDEFGGNGRVELVHGYDPGHANPNYNKCGLLNRIITLSNAQEGDILMLCDSDEFYNDAAVAELKGEFTRNDWDMLQVCDMFFCVDMEHIVKSSHGRFWRYQRGGCFAPTQNMQPFPQKRKLALKNNRMFHYSMLINPDMRKTYWGLTSEPHKSEWFDRVYSPWDPDDEKKGEKLARMNEQITGHKGFWMNSGVDEICGWPYLYEFDGKHPEEVGDIGQR